jgi:hypothetical protein
LSSISKIKAAKDQDSGSNDFCFIRQLSLVGRWPVPSCRREIEMERDEWRLHERRRNEKEEISK